jgi:hypothetical protein
VKLAAAHQRTAISNDIPLQEVMDQHLDEDPQRLRKITRKVDIRLTLMLAILYTCAFIDRSNLGNVRFCRRSCSYLLIYAAGIYRWHERRLGARCRRPVLDRCYDCKPSR